jgi:signal transduction histidine kinase
MLSKTSRDAHGQSVPFLGAARVQLRRLHWAWMLMWIVAYAGWDLIDQYFLTRIAPILGGVFVDWSVAALFGLLMVLLFSRWEDRQLARIAALEAEHAAAERKLTQLEAVQATARAVAHTINQPLAVIRATVELFRDSTPTERSDTDLAIVLEQVDRAAALVRQFLAITDYHTVPYPGGAPMLDLAGHVEAAERRR